MSASPGEPFISMEIVLRAIPARSWNALCDRDPVLAGMLEAGAFSYMSDDQLVAFLVGQGVEVLRDAG